MTDHTTDEQPATGEGPKDQDRGRVVSDTYDAVKRWVWRIETWSVVLIALATVATAWGAYQATRWSGVQSVNFVQANTARSESIRASNLAGQQASVDVNLWTDWVAAKAVGDDRLADFLAERFRDEFTPAFEAWLEQPRVDGIPDGTPFERPEYILSKRVEAQDLEDDAAAFFEAGKQANQTGDNYILVSVLFASVLFFAGVSTRFERIRPKIVLLGLGSIIFVAAIIIEVILPRSIGF